VLLLPLMLPVAAAGRLAVDPSTSQVGAAQQPTAVVLQPYCGFGHKCRHLVMPEAAPAATACMQRSVALERIHHSRAAGRQQQRPPFLRASAQNAHQSRVHFLLPPHLDTIKSVEYDCKLRCDAGDTPCR
jgi:hypothetical protein